MMNVPTTKPYFPPEDIEEILKGMEEILSSGRFIKGKFLSTFEEEFARFIGTKHAVAVNSGTAALEIVYRYYDVTGKEVITTNDEKLAAFARSLRFHGEDKTRGIQDRIGNNWMLSEPQALIGYVQTKRLSEIVEKRMAIAKRYD